MKHVKLLLVFLCLSGLFACDGGGSGSTASDGDPTPPGGGEPPPSPPGEEPPVTDNTAADVKLWGRQDAFDEASAIIDTDLINAERSVAR